MVALSNNLSLIVYHVDCNVAGTEDPQMVPAGPLYTTPVSQSQHYECPLCKIEIAVCLLNEVKRNAQTE
jgi:hypothetical protein